MRAILDQTDKADLGKGAVARLAAGRPKAATLAGSSATSSVLPSRLTRCQCLNQAPRVARVAIGPTICSCSRRIGSAPSRLRACEMPDLPATLTDIDGSSSHCTPSHEGVLCQAVIGSPASSQSLGLTGAAIPSSRPALRQARARSEGPGGPEGPAEGGAQASWTAASTLACRRAGGRNSARLVHPHPDRSSPPAL